MTPVSVEIRNVALSFGATQVLRDINPEVDLRVMNEPVGPGNAEALLRDADLLMLESTLPRPERTGMRGHLTPEEAGDHAKRAGARQLVLTHFSDELDRLVKSDAEKSYGAQVSLAAEGTVFTV